MKKLLERYRFFLILAAANLVLLVISPAIGWKALGLTGQNALEMLSVIPPIFILLGLLDVWVDREIMIRLMGEKSGLTGAAIAFFLGSAAAGPLYAAFPVAGVLLKKGSKFSNVLIFIGAWSTTKIPMLLFETTAMGWKFMLTRFMINLPGIAFIAFATEKMLKDKEKESIYSHSAALN